jgi:glycerophosphoryl diester phosphodiesterase
MKSFLLTTALLLTMSTSAGQPMIVAHRGVPGAAPENTIPSFKLAWEQGADAIEGDFHLTKDGHIVCIHDDTTKKVSTTNLVVNKSTLAELRELDVGVRKGETFKGTRIPTIAEVFSIIPEQKMIYIEVKCGVEIITPLLKEIAKSGLTEEQILIISFHEKVLQELKVQAPKYRTSWLCSFKKQKTGVITPSTETVMNTLKRIDADGLSSNTDIPESLIETVLQQGYQWHVWTVDDPKTASRMKVLGAKSITTNVPKTIRTHLVEPSPAAEALKTAPKE